MYEERGKFRIGVDIGMTHINHPNEPLRHPIPFFAARGPKRQC